MNARGQRELALEFRQRAEAEQYRNEAERARQTAKQAVSARDRAFWLALAANWKKARQRGGSAEDQALGNINRAGSPAPTRPRRSPLPWLIEPLIPPIRDHGHRSLMRLCQF